MATIYVTINLYRTPPAVDNTPILLIINPAPTAPNNAPPKAEQTPVIEQSAAIVCFKLTLACTINYIVLLLINLRT